ncbi:MULTISPECIES: TnsA endonuclease N-terminal domain-containing protein [unclassified Variovorax]|uniref:TnsA endonuclease N-terminal domain-containing protein n=1 Tax=unclassified Variovorax TaxID=663243 RepID=UPI0008B32E97|nr:MULTISPECIES: TnsA endonuclease N-terminal domain-containing protein [unclassified Variovorax]SEK14925.1 TnsA endonuclease N terminal [Variovorax sp. OK202]SFE06346.1 TnsA endonuclease N terminal [Variovorax sp. OK212]
MGRKATVWTQEKVFARKRDGHGQGTHSSYKPWLTVRDFSSIGTTTRLFSPKLGRTVTLFSNIERNAFLWFESLRTFFDYFDQKPVPLEVSMQIADELGINHPYMLKTREPAIVTLDGVLMQSDGRERHIDCKPLAELKNKRTMEKLALRREYARRVGAEYILVTEETIPRVVVHNLQWIRMAAVRGSWSENLGGSVDEDMTSEFHRALSHASEHEPAERLLQFLERFDRQFGCACGAANWALRRLLWSHQARFDLTTSFRSLLVGPLGTLSLATPDACLSAAAERPPGPASGVLSQRPASASAAPQIHG